MFSLDTSSWTLSFAAGQHRRAAAADADESKVFALYPQSPCLYLLGCRRSNASVVQWSGRVPSGFCTRYHAPRLHLSVLIVCRSCRDCALAICEEDASMRPISTEGDPSVIGFRIQMRNKSHASIPCPPGVCF